MTPASDQSAPPPRAPEASSFGGWLRESGALLALLRDNTFRRNLLAILVLNLRRLMGWRFAAALVIFPALTSWLAWRYSVSAEQTYDILQGLLALAALGSASSFYASEQQAGTFELLWLSTGSEKSMLRFRAIAETMMMLLLAAPCVFVVGLFAPTEGMGRAMALFLIVTNGWFLFAAMAWLGTWFSQAWAAGLLGIAVVAVWFFVFQGSHSMFYPFPNPFPGLAGPQVPNMFGPQQQPVSIGPNRVFFLGLSAIFLRAAAKRLRSVF